MSVQTIKALMGVINNALVNSTEEGDARDEAIEASRQIDVLLSALERQPAPAVQLTRYGLKWTGPSDFVAKPMEDGYWTPWHIVQAAVEGRYADNIMPCQPAPTDEQISDIIFEHLSWSNGWVNNTGSFYESVKDAAKAIAALQGEK